MPSRCSTPHRMMDGARRSNQANATEEPSAHGRIVPHFTSMKGGKVFVSTHCFMSSARLLIACSSGNQNVAVSSCSLSTQNCDLVNTC